MHLLSCIFILVTLHLQHITSLPATLKQRQQAAQMMDWNDIIKLDFSPHGIKKEFNLDMGLFALRSKQTLKFGEEVLEEETLRRRKRALNVAPEAAPCYSKGGRMGTGGGGGVDYDDVVGRRRSQKKSKLAAKAKSMLNKLKKKKLVSEGVLERHRRDLQDITDKAGELMERGRKLFMNFINKLRKFSENVIERIKDRKQSQEEVNWE